MENNKLVNIKPSPELIVKLALRDRLAKLLTNYNFVGNPYLNDNTNYLFKNLSRRTVSILRITGQVEFYDHVNNEKIQFTLANEENYDIIALYLSNL